MRGGQTKLLHEIKASSETAAEALTHLVRVLEIAEEQGIASSPSNCVLYLTDVIHSLEELGTSMDEQLRSLSPGDTPGKSRSGPASER